MSDDGELLCQSPVLETYLHKSILVDIVVNFERHTGVIGAVLEKRSVLCDIQRSLYNVGSFVHPS